jgi:hypothetical protein
LLCESIRASPANHVIRESSVAEHDDCRDDCAMLSQDALPTPAADAQTIIAQPRAQIQSQQIQLKFEQTRNGF